MILNDFNALNMSFSFFNICFLLILFTHPDHPESLFVMISCGHAGLKFS